ncbi:MAG: hypothetical protein [Microviridae sp.]|nr:MAG: hypothetical protein [Microviridae sp.]
MYNKRTAPYKTSIKRNESYEAISIERKIERMMNNQEPIGDGAEITYTERKDGVAPEMDIRTDRWELGVEARDKIARSNIAKREEGIGTRTYDTMSDEQRKEFHTKFPDNPLSQKAKGGEQGT